MCCRGKVEHGKLMALDDFRSDDDEDVNESQLKSDPPGNFSDWKNAEPGLPDWYDWTRGSVEELDNHKFNGQEVLVVQETNEENSCYVASDKYQSLRTML